MDVFVVLADFDDEPVVGVFASLELAQAAVARRWSQHTPWLASPHGGYWDCTTAEGSLELVMIQQQQLQMAEG